MANPLINSGDAVLVVYNWQLWQYQLITCFFEKCWMC